jgi:putative acetyltransferase
MIIRAESASDRAAVYAVNVAAFARDGEAKLVDVVRNEGARDGPDGLISLVADDGARVVGHVLFTVIEVHGESPGRAMGLGPVAVIPDRQRQGVGSALIRAGLDACRAAGHDVVFVVGHPAYYPRFGFRPARPLGLTWEHPVPDDVFMVLELTPGAAARLRGVVKYRPEFDAV